MDGFRCMMRMDKKRKRIDDNPVTFDQMNADGNSEDYSTPVKAAEPPAKKKKDKEVHGSNEVHISHARFSFALF